MPAVPAASPLGKSLTASALASPAPAAASASPSAALPAALAGVRLFALKARGGVKPTAFQLVPDPAAAAAAPDYILQWGPPRPAAASPAASAAAAAAPAGLLRVEGQLRLSDFATIRTTAPPAGPHAFIVRVSPLSLAAARDAGGLLFVEVSAAATAAASAAAAVAAGEAVVAYGDALAALHATVAAARKR